MAWRRLQVTLAVLMVTATAATLQSAAQLQPAAAFFPSLPSCPPAPLSLSPCIGYVFGVGSATLTACCSQLRSFLRVQAPCLCAASKLAPNPVGLMIAQARTMMPNVCDLPNPCDDAAAAGDGEGSAPAEASTPTVAGTAPPSETATTPAATTASPATEEPTPSAPAADPDASGAPAAPAEDDSPAATMAPAGAGSKLPQLLHAAGATSSRGMDAGTVFATVFVASVAAMYV